MTYQKQLTGFTGLSKEVPLSFTVFYSPLQKEARRYQIEDNKEQVDIEDVNAVGKSQQEHQGLKKTIELLTNVLNQLI